METSNQANGFKSVSGLAQGDIKFISAKKLFDAGTTGLVAEGTYEGRVDEQTKYGPKSHVKIRGLDGQTIIVNEAGNLDYRMTQAVEQGLQLGTPIQISYLGKSPMVSGPFKGTLAHSFDVAIEVLDEAA